MAKGQVILVGAGCGRDLCTLAGLKAIREASLIVYDDLLDPALLKERSADAHCLYVGKRSGRHSMRQEEINALLVQEAEKGHRVVRLKGGDSFVFGRGGEEIQALQTAGIPYTLIPGVSSAVAVPEHLGLPVTHRGMARSFTVVTGHTKDDSTESWEALAKLQGTLVFLMGVHRLTEICQELMRHGKAKDTPASILFRGYGKDEERVDGTLETLPAEAAGKLRTPGIIVVGETAGLHFEGTLRKPLEGKQIRVVGSESFTALCRERLLREGAEVDAVEAIRILPAPERIPAAAELASFDWLLFTSRNGIRIFFDELSRRRQDTRCLFGLRIACIGSGTAEELATHGIFADFVPTEFTALALGRELSEQLHGGERLLILRAENGSRMLNQALTEAGVDFEDRAIYDTQECVEELSSAPETDSLPAAEDNVFGPESRAYGSGNAQREADAPDYLVFASAGGVEAYLRCRSIPAETLPVCIGEYTAERLAAHGYKQYLTARPHSAEGIADCILKHVCGKE